MTELDRSDPSPMDPGLDTVINCRDVSHSRAKGHRLHVARLVVVSAAARVYLVLLSEVGHSGTVRIVDVQLEFEQ